MKTIIAHDFPGRKINLSYPLTEEVGSLEEVTSLGLEAVKAIMGDYLEFYCVDIELSNYDINLWYPTEDIAEEEATWLLKKTEIPQDVICEQFFRKQQIKKFKHLGTQSVHDFIKGITQVQSPVADSIRFWRSIEFRSVKVVLEQWKDESFLLQRGTHLIEYPIENNGESFFINGPLKNRTLVSPISISLQNLEGHQIDLDISLHWSYWTDEHSEGASLIKQALTFLEAKGWQLSFSQVAYAQV